MVFGGACGGGPAGTFCSVAAGTFCSGPAGTFCSGAAGSDWAGAAGSDWAGGATTRCFASGNSGRCSQSRSVLSAVFCSMAASQDGAAPFARRWPVERVRVTISCSTLSSCRGVYSRPACWAAFRSIWSSQPGAAPSESEPVPVPSGLEGTPNPSDSLVSVPRPKGSGSSSSRETRRRLAS